MRTAEVLGFLWAQDHLPFACSPTSIPRNSAQQCEPHTFTCTTWPPARGLQIGYPNAVLAAVVACKNGVKRAHLIDADSDG